MSSNVVAVRLAAWSRIGGPLGAIVLGLALLGLGGFVQSRALHHGAHDARHAANFPCH